MKQPAAAVGLKLTSDGNMVSTWSAPEQCRGLAGCLQNYVLFAMGEIRAAMEMTMGDVFEVRSSALRPERLAHGTAVMYSNILCVVHCEDSSRPLRIVRKSTAGKFLCESCTTRKDECAHLGAAGRAVPVSAVREADETFDPSSTVSDSDEDAINGTRSTPVAVSGSPHPPPSSTAKGRVPEHAL